ncbi:MAG: di-heme oxidoredictase family protein [Candidatus Kapaibacterium sp.]
MALSSLRTYVGILSIPFLALVLSACSNTSDPGTVLDERESGGATTVDDASSAAFGLPANNLTGTSLDKHLLGDRAFEATFISDTVIHTRGGLGPIYNNTSCRGCHILDGRGGPPGPGEGLKTMLLRVSIAGTDAHGGPNPIPGFGGQFQPRSVAGVKKEGDAEITYAEMPGTFADGTTYSLRMPTYRIINEYTALPAVYFISPRVAPTVFGLGLLEAIPDQTLIQLADESDRNKDGISGKINYVYDAQTGQRAIGRFGAKSNTPNLRQQSAGAYNEDMGITSTIFPVESSHSQAQFPGTHAPEVDDATLDATTFYVSTLAVPARRNVNDPTVRRGQQIFSDAKCAGCHIPTLQTGDHKIAELANQTIHPYTDLLVHDMGEALSDHRPDFLANGNEWRTSALWGLGLTRITSGQIFLLHDGRARSIVEAIMWHGGEAEASREYVRKLSTSDRQALLEFMNSL